jgi:hypothetical protein
VVLGRCGLGRVALGARRLSLYHRDEIVVTATLVILLLLEARGRPFAVVHDLLPLALKDVERRGDHFLACHSSSSRRKNACLHIVDGQ